MKCYSFKSSLTLVVALGLASGLWAQDKPAEKPADKTAPKITYDEHVVPILREKCFSCHNPDKVSGDLNLTTFSTLMKGGASGEAVLPGDPDASYLFSLVSHTSEPHMPPKADKLPQAQLDIIRQWIAGGLLENSGSKARTSNKPKIDLKLASAATGKPEGPPPMPAGVILEPVVRTVRSTAVRAAASPWAPLVAVGGQKQVLLYHADSLELLGVLPFPEGVPHVLKFSRNGALLLAGGGHGSKAGRVAVWNVATGERVFTLGDEFDMVLAADISADQSHIALGGPSKIVRVYSTKDGQLEYEIKKHTDWIFTLEFSPDGVLLATGDRNGGMFVWESDTGREYLSLSGHTAAINDISWRSDANLLASASEDGTVRLWEMENGRLVKNWPAHGGGAASVEFARDGRVVSCGRDKITKLWDQNGAQQRAFDAFADLALSVTVSHDMSRIIAGDWTGQIRVWAAADGKALGELSANPPTLAERITAATAQLAAGKTEHDRLAAVAAASQTAADKAAADLAAGKKALDESAAKGKAAADAVAAATQTLTTANAALAAAQKDTAARQEAAKPLGEAFAKAQEAAAKLPADQGLAQAAAGLKPLVDKLTAEIAAGTKVVTDQTALVKTTTEQLAAAQKIVAQSAIDTPAAQKQFEALTAAVKPAADKAAADKAAVAPAAAALLAHQAAVEKWTAAQAQAQK